MNDNAIAIVGEAPPVSTIDVLQFITELGLKLCWFREGPVVITNTRDEAVMRVLVEQGATAHSYPAWAHKGWEIGLHRLDEGVRELAVLSRAGTLPAGNAAPLHDRLAELRRIGSEKELPAP